ncbi:MAG: hypothetical protein K8I82_12485, partial [Anaerolineae bacterium]|nr:hypothetical protein [Anaerolineae bacterium]
THTTWLVIGAALVTGFGLLSDNATFSKHLRVELIYGCAASLVGISLLLTYVKFTEQMHDLRQEQWILDLQAAQKWARKNTAPDDMFLGTEISWRSIAWRPYLYFDPIWRWYIYLPDQRLLDNQARLRAWYGITPQEDHLVQSNNLFYQFSSQELLSLREQEGVDYLLRRRDLPVEAWGGQLNFAVVYENTTFQLYDLHHPLSDLWDKNDQAVQAEWAGHISDEDGFILDAAGGLNSLRPSMALDYIPQNHRIRKKLIPYGLYEKNYLAAIWQYRSPAPLLHELGIKYVYVDKTWLGDAPAAAQHALQNPSQFEEIFTLQERGLYRVQESVLEVYPPAIMTMDIILRVVNMQLYDDWLTTGIDPNAVILLPRDNLGLGLTDYLAGVRLPEMLDAEAQAAFQHWQTSKLPAELHTAGVDYLLVDHLWWQYLTPAEATLLNDPALYELVKEWQVDGFAAPFYRLYKVR